ncbi:hypothetical protein ACFLTE_02970 [Bacteroidota bacterium]
MKTLLLIIISFLSILVYPQTFEEYYRQKQKEYESYYDQTEETYKKFIEERDKEFSEHLKQNWELFKMMEKKFYDSKPKPIDMPVYIDSLGKKVNIIEYYKPELDTISFKPSIRKVKPTESFSFYKKKITSFSFYEEIIEIEHEDISIIKPVETYNNNVISENWDKLNKLDFYNCIPQLNQYKKSFGLNDWGYYLLAREFSKNLTNDNQYYKLLLWYLLLKSDYLVKLGYTTNDLLLLIPFNTDIFEVPYYEINNEIYYVFEMENPGSIKTYVQNYPGAEIYINPTISNPPIFNTDIKKKNLEYFYKGQLQPLTVEINTQLKEFYNSYPLMNLENYFQSEMSDYTKTSLYESIQNKVKNKSEEEAVGYLLNLSQNGFKYMTDNEQFGKEKIFFPDELFYYTYSDCEDRSVFFAYLVKNFLNLNVIGLEYTDHVAVAVNFNEEVSGNYLNYKGKKYVICDPTYINAPIGKTLPKHLDSKAHLIEIKN